MVNALSIRELGSAADLRGMRAQLRRYITRYAGAVVTMLDDNVPETLDIVESALKPLLTMRASRSSTAPETADEVPAEPDVPEQDLGE